MILSAFHVVRRRHNLELGQQFIGSIGTSQAADGTTPTFVQDVSCEILGQTGFLSRAGRGAGRDAVAESIAEKCELPEPVKFDIEEVSASGEQAVFVDDLASCFRSTGKAVESPFTVIFTSAGGRIAKFQTLERSFAVSRAANA